MDSNGENRKKFPGDLAGTIDLGRDDRCGTSGRHPSAAPAPNPDPACALFALRMELDILEVEFPSRVIAMSGHQKNHVRRIEVQGLLRLRGILHHRVLPDDEGTFFKGDLHALDAEGSSFPPDLRPALRIEGAIPTVSSPRNLLRFMQSKT